MTNTESGVCNKIDVKGDVNQSDSILAQYKVWMGNYLNEVLESE